MIMKRLQRDQWRSMIMKRSQCDQWRSMILKRSQVRCLRGHPSRHSPWSQACPMSVWPRFWRRRRCRSWWSASRRASWADTGVRWRCARCRTWTPTRTSASTSRTGLVVCRTSLPTDAGVTLKNSSPPQINLGVILAYLYVRITSPNTRK